MTEPIGDGLAETRGPIVWTPEYAGRVLVDSFLHSQGNHELQIDIITYLHNKYPAWRIESDDFYSAALNHATVLATEATGSHNHRRITSGEISSNLEEVLSEMRDIFDQEQVDNANIDLVPIIANEMVSIDNIRISKGRPRGSSRRNTAQSHPRSSFIIDYGYKKTKTDIQGIDSLYEDVIEYIEEERRGSTYDWIILLEPAMTNIITTYNEHHTDRFELPTS